MNAIVAAVARPFAMAGGRGWPRSARRRCGSCPAPSTPSASCSAGPGSTTPPRSATRPRARSSSRSWAGSRATSPEAPVRVRRSPPMAASRTSRPACGPGRDAAPARAAQPVLLRRPPVDRHDHRPQDPRRCVLGQGPQRPVFDRPRARAVVDPLLDDAAVLGAGLRAVHRLLHLHRRRRPVPGRDLQRRPLPRRHRPAQHAPRPVAARVALPRDLHRRRGRQLHRGPAQELRRPGRHPVAVEHRRTARARPTPRRSRRSTWRRSAATSAGTSWRSRRRPTSRSCRGARSR